MKKKMKWIKSLDKVAIIIPLVILIYGINLFWVGFHNIDLCHNEISIQNQISEDLRTINKSFVIVEHRVFNGEVWSLKDCYLNGLGSLIKGFYISLLGAFLLGYVKK